MRIRLSRKPAPDAAALEEVMCPFLARTLSPGRTHICLSGEEPLAISRRYVDSYCLSAEHVECSLYLAAYRSAQIEREPEPVEDDGAVPEIPVAEIREERPIQSQMVTPAVVPTAEVGEAHDMVAASRPVVENSEDENVVADRPAARAAIPPLPAVPTFAPVPAGDPASVDSLALRPWALERARYLGGVEEDLSRCLEERRVAIADLTQTIVAAEANVGGQARLTAALSRAGDPPTDEQMGALLEASRKLADNPNSLGAYGAVLEHLAALKRVVDDYAAIAGMVEETRSEQIPSADGAG